MTVLRRHRTSVVGMLLFVFAMWQYTAAIDDREFHRDEARWIHRAEYLRELRHPFSSYWDESTWRDGGSLDERNRLRAQPPMGSYLMGIGFLLQGKPLPEIGYWNMDRDPEWNAANGNLPSDDMLKTARRTTATLGALTVVAMFLVASRLTSLTGAMITGVYLAVHPLARYLATFAGSDAALVFFIACSTLAAARLAEKPGWSRAVVLGILLGLGGSTKLTPLGMAAALAAWGVILITLARGQRRTSRHLGWMLASTPIIAFATFVASYPYLWSAPTRNSLRILRYRTFGMELQGSLWEHVAVNSPGEAIQRIWDRFTSADWSVIGRYLHESTRIEMVLALGGIALICWIAFRRGFSSNAMMILISIGSIVAITILGMGVDWARYHYPILLATSLSIGVLIGRILPFGGNKPARG